MRFAAHPPESHPNACLALIADRQSAFLPRGAVFEGQGARRAKIKDDSDHVDCLLLHHFLDGLQSRERKAITFDMSIVIALLNNSAVVERQTVVVLDGGVSLVGQLDLPVGEGVDLLRLEHIVKLGGSVVEAGRLDERAFSVDQVDIQKLTFAFLVFPIAQLCFLDDAGLDYPIRAELVKGLNRHIGI